VLRGLGQERFEVAHLALHDRVHVTVDEFVRVRASAVVVLQRGGTQLTRRALLRARVDVDTWRFIIVGTGPSGGLVLARVERPPKYWSQRYARAVATLPVDRRCEYDGLERKTTRTGRRRRATAANNHMRKIRTAGQRSTRCGGTLLQARSATRLRPQTVVLQIDDGPAPISHWVDAMRRLSAIDDPLARRILALHRDCGSGTGECDSGLDEMPMAMRADWGCETTAVIAMHFGVARIRRVRTAERVIPRLTFSGCDHEPPARAGKDGQSPTWAGTHPGDDRFGGQRRHRPRR
jgi:hypothetical protein